MRGRFSILFALWVCSACSVNENVNHGVRCGEGVLCAASEVCYRGFCTVNPQSSVGGGAAEFASGIDSGAGSVEGANGPVDSSGSGPGVVAPGGDAGAQAVAAIDSGAVSSPALPDAGEAVVTAPVDNQVPGVPSSATAGPASVLSTRLPSDGNRGSVCYTDKPCGKSLFCHAPSGGTTQYPGICVDGCRTDANCPAIEGLVQVCSSDGQCHVDCAGAQSKGDGTCPANEICRDLSIPLVGPTAWQCTYADNAGSRAAPTYGACSTQHGGGDCANGGFCHVPAAGPAFPTGQAPVAGYCTGACAVATDCAVPAGTTAKPLCTSARCELDCGGAGANTCPDKMNCRDISNNPLASVYRCVFID